MISGSEGVRVLDWGEGVTLDDLAARSLRRLHGFPGSDFGGRVHFGDGGRLLAVTGNEEIFLWEMDGWFREPLTTLDVANSSIVGFFDSGQRLVVTLVLHDTDELLRAACRAAGRNLTPREWDRFIGDRWPYRRGCPDLPVDGEMG